MALAKYFLVALLPIVSCQITKTLQDCNGTSASQCPGQWKECFLGVVDVVYTELSGNQTVTSKASLSDDCVTWERCNMSCSTYFNQSMAIRGRNYTSEFANRTVTICALSCCRKYLCLTSSTTTTVAPTSTSDAQLNVASLGLLLGAGLWAFLSILGGGFGPNLA